MNCEHVEELLSAYLDNALTPQERVVVQEHTSTCSTCSETLADYRHFDILLTDLPRVSPSAALRERIFASPDYLALTDAIHPHTTETPGVTSLHDFRHTRSSSQELPDVVQHEFLKHNRLPGVGERLTLPQKPVGRDNKEHPHLVALPGGLQETKPSIPAQGQRKRHHNSTSNSLRFMQIAIVACLLLTLGVGGFIGWNVLQQQQSIATLSGGITPPLGPRLGGPLPTGTRFVYLHDGALWSGSTDTTGGTASVNTPARLTSTSVIVSSHWSVQPAYSGHVAGTMLAYIDLKQGRVHIIRSDGQSDTAIAQPLIASNGTPASQWNTPTGTSILDSLAWSPDGSQFAFIAAPTGIAHVYVYKLSTAHLEMMPVSPQGEVLSLNWTSVANASTLTWSVGTVGHVSAIMQQQPGSSASSAQTIVTGDYAGATYNNRAGSWLLLSQGHDVFTLTMSGILNRWTTSGSVSSAIWSPEGSYISYFSHPNAGNSEYRIINLATGSDTHVASDVATNVAPVWSPDEKELLYTDGTYISVTSIDGTSTTSIRLPGATLLAWNPATPHQAIIELQGSKSGLYLLDTVHKTVTQVSKSSITNPMLWTEIP